MGLRKTPDMTIEEYGSHHQKVCAEIGAIDASLVIPDHLAIQMFLNGLGESWQTWYSVLSQTAV